MKGKHLWIAAGATAIIVVGIVVFALFRSGNGGSLGSVITLSGGGDPASAQEQTLDVLGAPAHFVIEYLPLARDSGEALSREETWFYPDIGKSVTFIGGNIARTERLDPATLPPHATPLFPTDYDYTITPEEFAAGTGETVMPAEAYPGITDVEGMTLVVSPTAFALFDDGALAYLATLDPGASTTPAQAPILGVVPPGSEGGVKDLGFISVAEAKSPFKQFFRCVKKVCKFVVEVPEKITRPITRPLGPVIGPIVSGILTQNISQGTQIGRVIRDARRIDQVMKNVDEQRKLVGELRQVYRDQANELSRRADELKKDRDTLKERLVHGVITFDEFKRSIADLDRVVAGLEDGAKAMQSAGDRVNEGSILRLLGADVLRLLASQSEGILSSAIGNEIHRIAGMDVVLNLIGQGDRGANAVLDLLISGELRGSLAGGDGGVDLERLKSEVRSGLREMLAQNKKDLRAHWKDRIAELIRKKREELTRNLPKPPELPIAESVCEETQTKASGARCDPGYVFQRMSGVGCVQENCASIPGAHWSYEGYCVCGSSGSMFEDPNDANKECYLPRACSACPGCVYACVHFDEACLGYPAKGDETFGVAGR